MTNQVKLWGVAFLILWGAQVYITHELSAFSQSSDELWKFLARGAGTFAGALLMGALTTWAIRSFRKTRPFQELILMCASAWIVIHTVERILNS